MLPKFSIRQLLWGTVAFAVLAIGIAAAYRGNLIAYGLVLAPLLMVIPFAVLAFVYWLGYLFSMLFFRPIHSHEISSFSNSTQPLPTTEEQSE